jgi:putative two-component system response regulator
MVVDDEPTNVKVVSRLLKLDGYEDFITTTDARTAVEMARRELPDLILLDVMMPHVSGLEILSTMRLAEETRFTPVVILTASTDRETRLDALHRGATDFLNKPIDPSELVLRVHNVLSIKTYQDQLKNYSRDLEAAVRLRTAQLEDSQQDVIRCLARAAEYRDDDTGHHVVRVGKYVRIVAEAMGICGRELDTLEQASQLHDVGKIGIPDYVLLKPGKLTAEEFAIIQTHSLIGDRILERCTQEEEIALVGHTELGAAMLDVGHSHVLDLARRIALTHHEWWNGEGYPYGLRGDDIPLAGRITAVADVFDALSTRRCYKDAFPVEECFSIMEAKRGAQFDPHVLDKFLENRERILNVKMQYVDDIDGVTSRRVTDAAVWQGPLQRP